MPSLLEILKDPNYINANPATKEAIFNKYAPQDENFTGANQATQEAVKQRFGLVGLTEEPTTPTAPAPIQETMPFAHPSVKGYFSIHLLIRGRNPCGV
jgi:hypothetical protein